MPIASSSLTAVEVGVSPEKRLIDVLAELAVILVVQSNRAQNLVLARRPAGVPQQK